MHDAVLVRMFERLAHFVGDLDYLGKWQPMALGLLNEAPHISSRHELTHEIRRTVFLANVKHRDHMWMVPELSHGLSFALNTLQPLSIEAFGLDQRKGHLPIEARVVDQINALLPTFAKKALDHVAASAKGGGVR